MGIAGDVSWVSTGVEPWLRERQLQPWLDTCVYAVNARILAYSTLVKVGGDVKVRHGKDGLR